MIATVGVLKICDRHVIDVKYINVSTILQEVRYLGYVFNLRLQLTGDDLYFLSWGGGTLYFSQCKVRESGI